MPERREVGGEPLSVLRRGGRIDVLADVSAHLGEPLTEGLLDGDALETSAGSVFDVRTGEVLHGPATAPAVRLESRVAGDLVEVRLPQP